MAKKLRLAAGTLLVVVLAAAPSALAQQEGDDVSIGKYHSITSKVLGEERTFLISLPEGYATSTDKYPVLYVLDGSVRALVEGSQATTWAHRGVPPMIVVAITNPNRDRDVLPGAGSDGAEKYLRFISEELFPYVEQRFRVQNHRTLYGASNAGVFVLYALLERPDAFAAYIASSPTVGHRYDYMVAKATSTSRPLPRRHTQLHIVYGDKESPALREGLAKYRPVLEALKSDTLSITIRDLPEEGHVPIDGLAKGLKQVFDGYHYPFERVTKAGLPALESHYHQLSRRLGFRVPVPEDHLKSLGLFLLAYGRNAEVKAVARALEQNHPSGGFEHVLLAVVHFRANEMDLMREHYRLAQPALRDGNPPIGEWREWQKIVEAAKAGKSDPPGPRRPPATGLATR